MADERVLAVKVANLETALGLFEGGTLLGAWTSTTRQPATADELGLVISNLISTRELPEPDGAIMCSVVPMLSRAWAEALRARTGSRPLIVGPGLKNGLVMRYKDPGQVGSDRVVDAVAAKSLCTGPTVVADFDAATSLSVIDAKGAFLGGVIMPGPDVSAGALQLSAAQLAEVEMFRPKSVIGRTTAEAVRAGMVLGEAARLDGLIDMIGGEIGMPPKLIATGHHASTICAAAKHPFRIEPHLSLLGLKLIWNLNRG